MTTPSHRGPGSNQHQDKPPVAPRQATTGAGGGVGTTALADPFADDPYAGESEQDRMEAHHERIWRGEATGFDEEHLATDLAECTRMLEGVKAGRIKPSTVIGRGYKQPKAVALEYLEGRIETCKRDLASRGRTNAVNKSNAQGAAWTFDEVDAGAIPGEVTRQSMRVFSRSMSGDEVLEKYPDVAADYRTATGADIDPSAAYRMGRATAFTTDDTSGNEVELGEARAVIPWQDDVAPRQAYDQLNDMLAKAER